MFNIFAPSSPRTPLPQDRVPRYVVKSGDTQNPRGDTRNSRDTFGRARLVVLAVGVCGRWSRETQSFLSSLAHAKARCETSLIRRRVDQAWRLRWGSLFSVLWRRLCWNCPVPEAQMVIVRPHMRCNVTSSMLAWVISFVSGCV